MNCCMQSGKKNKVGICLKLNGAELLDYLAADYVEFPFADVTSLEIRAYEELKRTISRKNLECPVMTQLLPKTARVVDDGNAFGWLRDFLENGFERAQELHTGIIVFGNAGSRNCYDGERLKALDRLYDFCTQASDLAAQYGITICLEPLNRMQSNLINTLGEAIEAARIVDRPNFGIVWDYFHFQVEKDNLKSLVNNIDLLKHCHTADLLGRSLPNPDNQTEFAETLKRLEYVGAVSVEVERLPADVQQINHALQALRKSLE